MVGSRKIIVAVGGILMVAVSCLGMRGMYGNFGWPGVFGLALMIAIMVVLGYVSDYRKKSVPEKSGSVPENE